MKNCGLYHGRSASGIYRAIRILAVKQRKATTTRLSVWTLVQSEEAGHGRVNQGQTNLRIAKIDDGKADINGLGADVRCHERT